MYYLFLTGDILAQIFALGALLKRSSTNIQFHFLVSKKPVGKVRVRV